MIMSKSTLSLLMIWHPLVPDHQQRQCCLIHYSMYRASCTHTIEGANLFNTIFFDKFSPKTLHSMACLLGQDMECPLWVHRLEYCVTTELNKPQIIRNFHCLYIFSILSKWVTPSEWPLMSPTSLGHICGSK